MKFMATIGRNDPCRCGSGKKYGKCCRPADQQRAAELLRDGAALVIEDDGLDDLSNSVLDLLDTGRLEEAMLVCRRLLDEFPDVVDGLERSAMVHAKMGNHAVAADFFRRAHAFVTHPSRRHEYEGAEWYQEQAAKEEKLAGLR